jgi:hypothetical protein
VKGYRTLGFNAVMAAVPALLTFAVDVDWTNYVSPNVAMLIVTGANIGLRMVTTTPVGQRGSQKKLK